MDHKIKAIEKRLKIQEKAIMTEAQMLRKLFCKLSIEELDKSIDELLSKRKLDQKDENGKCFFHNEALDMDINKYLNSQLTT